MSTASSELVFAGGGRERPLVVRRSPAARSLRLSIDPRDGTVRLSLPARAPLRPALAWAEGKRGWVEAALAALVPPQPIAPGATIAIEGLAVTIDWRADAPRAAALDGDRLVVGGPASSLAARVQRWLKARALATLDAETRVLAAQAEVAVGRVAVGDPRSRWGSCSPAGDIRYSWRLILAPPEVRRATVAHEVAHRLHMHHGAAFHAEVARLFGRDPAAERRWLKANGAGLHAVGRSA